MNDKHWVLAFTYSGKTKQEILNLLFSDKRLKDSAYHIASYNDQELLQELYLEMNKLPDEKIMALNKNEYLLFFAVKALRNQYHTDRSSFYREVTKFQRKRLDLNEETYATIPDESDLTGFEMYSPLLPYIKKFIQENLHWYDRMVFLEVTEPGGSERKTAKKFGIPHSSIHETMTKVKKKILNYLKQKNYFQDEL